MAFIRTKRVKGILYRYRVESNRVGGKVQQRVLEYLGRASAKPSKNSNKPKAKAPAKKAAKAARKTVRKAQSRAKTKPRKSGRSKKKRK